MKSTYYHKIAAWLPPKAQDGLNYLTKFTVRKAWNAFLLVMSYYFAKAFKKNWHRGFPLSVSMEPTTACNLRCPECPSGLRSFTRPTGMLDAALFKALIDELAPELTYLLLYFQGEPYLHPAFLEMVAYAAKKKIYTATSTNAHFLSDAKARETVLSGLDRLVISIDGTEQDTYQAYRIGGDLEKVKEGAKRLVYWKKKLGSTTPYLIIQFLVVKPNEHQIPEIYALGKALGVDEVLLKTAQIYDYQQGSPLIPANPAYSRYQLQPDGTYTIKNSLENSCWKMWHSAVVTWDGKVVPCCFDKDAHHTLGTIGLTPFKAVWKAGAYRAFRGQLLQSRSQIAMCKNCTEGTKVWG